jgi:hypothetical protein
MQPGFEMVTDEAGGRPQRHERCRALFVSAEDTDEDARRAEIRRHLDVRETHESNSRILDLSADDIGQLLFDELTDLPGTPAHEITPR